MRLLLQPRSKELGKMFDLVVEGKLGSDNDFKEMMRKLGSSNNLLSISNFQEVLSKGLEELKAEGWIKPEEVAIVMKTDAQDRFL